jgi:Di-haem cytochrome c peroxidase
VNFVLSNTRTAEILKVMASRKQICFVLANALLVMALLIAPNLIAQVGQPAGSPDSTIAVLGRSLYFDKRLSIDGIVSCASCHDPATAFASRDTIAIGVRNQSARTKRQLSEDLRKAYPQAFPSEIEAVTKNLTDATAKKKAVKRFIDSLQAEVDWTHRHYVKDDEYIPYGEDIEAFLKREIAKPIIRWEDITTGSSTHKQSSGCEFTWFQSGWLIEAQFIHVKSLLTQ